MNTFTRLAVVLLVFAGCKKEAALQPEGARPSAAAPPKSAPPSGARLDTSPSLAEARKGHQTKLTAQLLAARESEPVPDSPPAIFATIKYKSPAGDLKAYVSPDPKDGKQHPAIVWITGGDCNSIGDVWSESNPKNEQSASAYRKAGIVMMFPSLRGGNDNPGKVESFYGEVDDVIAAADHLAKLPYVDPARIYLGGHSTGGTLALLVSECTDRFRAVISFGPAADIMGYGGQFVTFDGSAPNEYDLRSPYLWLEGIKSPTFVIEGTVEANDDSVKVMREERHSPAVKFFLVDGAGHFDILDPTNRLLAAKIVADAGPKCTISLTEDELRKQFSR